jgi:hypothetical protein
MSKTAVKTAGSAEPQMLVLYGVDQDGKPRSVKTIRNDRVKGNGVPFIKIGRLVRYRLPDVIAWEDANLRLSTSDKGAGNA